MGATIGEKRYVTAERYTATQTIGVDEPTHVTFETTFPIEEGDKLVVISVSKKDRCEKCGAYTIVREWMGKWLCRRCRAK